MGKKHLWLSTICIVLFVMLLTLYACNSTTTTAVPGKITRQDAQEQDLLPLAPVPLSQDEKLRVVATTSIVADVVGNIGGTWIELHVLTPVGSDPHSFEPTPRDLAVVSDAHVIFASGAGLEEFLEPLLESAGALEKVVHVSNGIAFREAEDEKNATEQDHRQGVDPHTWTDPSNVISWTYNIEHALSSLDPEAAETYAANAQAYEMALEDLDAWIEDQVAQVPDTNRRIVTDHATWGYFARRYGFEMVGAVIPGFSTLSEPSAQELAELQDAIRELGVKAVFVGTTVNPGLSQRVAGDTGVQLVFLYTGSLSKSTGPAGSYLDYMRYNVTQMVRALR